MAGLSVSFLPKMKSYLFFYLKEPKLGIFPAEYEFVVVKSSTQNLCFCSTVLKVGANIHAVKFFLLISDLFSLSCHNFLFNYIVFELCL